jgi:hypothetical protein
VVKIYYSLVKNGFTVNHEITGKKCMGIARPGNNSGFLMSNGSEMASGARILAKLSIVNTRLNIFS